MCGVRVIVSARLHVPSPRVLYWTPGTGVSLRVARVTGGRGTEVRWSVDAESAPLLRRLFLLLVSVCLLALTGQPPLSEASVLLRLPYSRVISPFSKMSTS